MASFQSLNWKRFFSQIFPPDFFRASWKIWLRRFGRLAGAGLGLLLLLVISVWAGLFGRSPSEAELSSVRNFNASRVYGSDGALLGKYYIQNRTEVAFEELPKPLVEALVATEDSRFYQHSGVDSRSMVRVLFKSLLLGDESAGGGSTISQQLAKNLYPRQSYGPLTMPVNKIQEMLIARKLERVYHKEEILEMYLNTVPFGENVFGIGAAAQRFFGVAPAKLKPQDAALLVGMLKATSYYNPRRYPERAVERRNVVLDLMEKNNYLSARASDSLRQLPLKLENRYERIDKEGLAPYFLQHLAAELKEILKDYKRPDGKPYNLYTDGLKIYTTLDSRLQQYAEKAVEDHMRQLQKSFDQHWKGKELWKESDPGIQRAIRQSDRYKALKAQGASDADIQAAFATPLPMKIWTSAGGERDTTLSPLDSIRHYLSHLQAGFLAMEPKSGRILAWVGGVHFQTFKYDHVTAKRQVGSTFKPLVYATALARGVDPCEYISNERITFEGGRDDWSPENADGKYGGYYSLQGGLSQSVNTVSAAVLMKVGVDEAWRAAHDYGLEELPRDPTLVLGTADLSLYEMVRAYSVFANRGLRAEPHYLLRIEDAQGNVIVKLKTPAPSKRVLEEPVADMMNHMLRSVVDSGTAGRLRKTYGLRGGLAGKTGTTQDQTDGWFIGYSPDLVAGAWVGGEERKVRFRSLSLGQGARTALPIFGLFMQQACNSSRFNKWQSSQFEPPPASALQSLDCPMYVLELPQEENLFFSPGEGQNALWDFIQRLKQKQEERRQRRIEESGEDPALYYEYTPNPEPRMLPPDSLPKRRSRWDIFRDQQGKRLEPEKP